MKDHEISKIVNELRDIAIDFHAAGQLRERIAYCIVDPLKSIAKLEAAFHQNMMRAYPERTHAEIAAEIERVKNSA